MCGRFTLRRPGPEIADHFGLSEVPELAPRYNVAPGQDIPVVRAPEPGQRVLELRRWGLVPAWARDPSVGSRLVNARSETAAGRRAFAAALARRRCLVPADGFYEWGAPGGGRRRPHHVGREDGSLFGIAGLWERWRGPDGRRIESCTLLTRAASGPVAGVHDRMPVILDPQAYAAWLDPERADPAAAEELLRRAAAEGEQLVLAPVGTRVNHVDHDDPACLEAPSEERQRSLPL